VAGRVPVGLREMALGAFFFSLMSVFVKLASRHLPSSHAVLARGVITLVMSWAAIRRRGLSPWGVDKKLLAVRGIAGFIGLNCFYYSVSHMPLADASVIQYLNPVFVAVLATVFLGERMRAREVACILASFVGVILVAQPPFLFHGFHGLHGAPVTSRLALVVAVCGAVASACAYTSIRKLRTTDDPAVVVFYFPLIAVPLSIPAVFADATMPRPIDWLFLVGVGVTTQIAQTFMTRGLHKEPAGRATGMSYLQVGFAYAWGILFFGEIPNAASIGGAVVVAVSIIVLAVGRTGAPG
jgi:drug/metabolite transporter (DMT)-like permease